MKTIDGKKVIWETDNFIVVAANRPFISREEGGHMMIRANGDKYRYDSRLDFSPNEVLEQQRLCQMICEAYKIAMEKRNIKIVRINFLKRVIGLGRKRKMVISQSHTIMNIFLEEQLMLKNRNFQMHHIYQIEKVDFMMDLNHLMMMI